TQIRAARSQDDDEDFGLEEVDDEDVGLEEVQDDDENFGLEEVGADENARLENNNKAKRAIEIVPSGKRYALLIGVNKYASPVKSLQYCVKDMELLSEGFQKTGVPKENIILVTDASSLERRPTGGNIRRQIEAITTLMEPNDQLIVAFSGHGAMVDGKSYLCPSDTDLKDKNSLVSRDWVFEKLEKCKAKQKVFIIDACRNEIAINGGKAIGQARTLEDPIGADAHGFILIASCDKRQYSMEHPDLQHGVFTYFFAEGLSGAAADEGGYISIIALYEYASSKTKMYVLRNFKQQQVPTFRQGGEMTDFCLAKVEAPSTESFKAGDRKVFKINGIEIAFRYCPPGKFMMGASQSEIDKILKSKLGNMNIPPEYLQQISQQIPQIKAYINNLIKSYSDLEKQHEVTLTKGFWMMETEVTVGMFKAFVAETGYKSVGNEIDSGAASLAASARRTYETGRMVPIEVKLSWNNPEFPQTDSHPVVYVSWDDAVAFCKWLSKKTGLKIQLPTEAQWEFACRAGTTSMPAGKLDEMAWIQDPMNFGRRSEDNAVDGWMQWSNFIATHPVGK
ncbi:MAG: SUMF1/EgtB/PvdO family nonheme iron enzyme, partial [Thermoguttaceae bacterium]|nr:SUMF1/EgtB/PvdO family nonheme iron enzyme [Thermoguttaceae bacterium]